jgi:hypothetical protein
MPKYRMTYCLLKALTPSMQHASEGPKPRLVRVMFSRALPADVVRCGRPGWVPMQRLEDAARSSHSIPAPRSAWSIKQSIVTGANSDLDESMSISTGCALRRCTLNTLSEHTTGQTCCRSKQEGEQGRPRWYLLDLKGTCSHSL